uniref:Repressor domain protein n=1 Tax=Siphoviridae sp. ctDmR33 TaxID=2825389 RepID=A0A8S5UWY9_9CAUD|nr:MAG TPA: repressor domain protein [Siphoviridae sp. ctDmR33]
MTNIQIFQNDQFGEIRTIEENGNILFCGSDVAKSLGYTNPSKALNDHCKGDLTKRYPIVDALGRQQDTIFILESDLYRLIFSSKLPSAETFTDWITEDVLPTIRKTGGYVANDDLFLATYLPNADDATKAMFTATLATVRTLNARIEADKPKVLFAEAVEAADNSILIGDLAKLLRQNGVDIGQRRLFGWLRDNGYLIKSGESKNMPTQYSMERGLMEVKERTVTLPNESIRVTRTTKITGKGQTFFVNKFLA